VVTEVLDRQSVNKTDDPTWNPFEDFLDEFGDIDIEM
jgi:hypothetical protein